MAKFNIEVELDWMEEDSYSIDEELKERIIEGVEDALLKKATHEALRMVDAKIAEKVKESEETINKDLLTTKYLKRELDDKIGNMIQRAKHEVEVDIVKSLEQKLKENLAKDTIEKMNIPEVLKKLQSGTLGMIEEKGQ